MLLAFDIASLRHALMLPPLFAMPPPLCCCCRGFAVAIAFDATRYAHRACAHEALRWLCLRHDVDVIIARFYC